MKADLPEDAVILVDDPSHESATAVMRLTDYVDCLIPRGGPASDPQHPRATRPCRSSSTATATVTCTWTRPPISTPRSRSSSTRRRTARACATRPNRWWCTQRWPTSSLPEAAAALVERGVELVGDAAAQRLAPAIGAATEDDFGREFLDLKMSVAVVPDARCRDRARQSVRNRSHRSHPHHRPRHRAPLHAARSTPPPSW